MLMAVGDNVSLTVSELTKSFGSGNNRLEVLKGINMVMEPDRLTMVATDGRRLALVEEEIEGGSKAEFIVPSKAVTELQRLLQGEGEVAISVGEKYAEFEIPQENGEPVKLHSKLAGSEKKGSVLFL